MAFEIHGSKVVDFAVYRDKSSLWHPHTITIRTIESIMRGKLFRVKFLNFFLHELEIHILPPQRKIH